jgi:crossover junction endodeoxyribonuclease RuvC
MSIILGIDPGSRITGYGLIKTQGSQIFYLASGCIRAENDLLSMRLLQIYQGLLSIIEEFKPNIAAIEQVFMHKNVSSALKLGHARAAAILSCAKVMPIYEYAPRKIKQCVVGYGNASKDQVGHMVQALLELSGSPQKDAADALAIAICHSYHEKNVLLQLANNSAI